MLDYKLIGDAARFKNGHGKLARYYAQKFRLLSDPPRKVRSVSLKTTDKGVARRRAVEYVEEKVRTLALAGSPQLRTKHADIHATLKEYLDDMRAVGDTEKQVELVKGRIERIIKQAELTQYAQLDAPTVRKAISELRRNSKFATATANRYREAMRAWTHWMDREERWPTDPLRNLGKFKGDTSSTRPRAILTEEQFETLLRVTRGEPERRCLTGEQRYWLYLTASQTGLRARELYGLTPANFRLDEDQPHVEIANTISKRGKKTGKKDWIDLHTRYGQLLWTAV